MGGKEVGGGERRGCEICEGLRKYSGSTVRWDKQAVLAGSRMQSFK